MAAVVVDSLSVPLDVNQAVFATGIGAVSFPIILGMNQIGLKTMRISSGSPLLISSIAGGISVTLASLVASTAIIKTCTMFRTTPNYNTRIDFTVNELLTSTVTGVVLFRAFGGRFSSVLPSHLNAPGSFARHWIPAYSVQYANNIQKSIIQEIGKKYGCHSCGTKRIKQYYADHQPPNKLIKSHLESLGKTSEQNGDFMQQFYPHCPSCSILQGHSLSIDSKISPIITHTTTLRPYHVYFPTSILLLLLKSSLSESKTIESSSVEDSQEVTVTTSVDHVVINEIKQNEASGKLTRLVTSFPLLIVWQRIVQFIDSFSYVGSFHMTLWGFTIIAALGSI